MVASISARVYTGTDAATESSSVLGVNLISADNATNSLANQAEFPVIAGTNSYSKWIRLKIDTAPDNAVSNFQWWSTGEGVDGLNLRVLLGLTIGVTPSTDSLDTLGDDADFFAYTVDEKGIWDSGTYTTVGDLTNFLVMQFQPQTSADPGNFDATLFYSYDET